jgi:hypothetical protein
MEDDLKFISNGRRPQFYLKWKTTSILSQMEDDINFIYNGRRPQLYFKWKTTSILFQMEDDLNLFSNGRRPTLSFHMEVNLYILLLQKRRQLKFSTTKKTTSIL